MFKPSQAAHYFRAMRPHHYLKNLLVYAALAFSGKLFEFDKLLHASIGFGVFCAASSAIYIINDIRDADKDRMHPTKRYRPIASGQLPVRNAWVLATLLIAAAFAGNAIVFDPTATILLMLYIGLNLMYSAGLKNLPLVDITIVVAGFLLRVVYGAIITDIEISNWLYLTVITLAYYLALGKRRNELAEAAEHGETRKVLQYYTQSFLDKNMHICLGLALAFYALWCMDAKTASRYSGVQLVFTVPIVLLITMRYSMDVEGSSDGDPVEVLVHDRPLLALCLGYFAVMFACLYL